MKRASLADERETGPESARGDGSKSTADSSTKSPSLVRRTLSTALDTSDLAINHYRIDPGGRFPAGLHAHRDQEECFVVLSGRATFETLDGAVVVGADEAVRFAPGEYQAGRNDGDAPLSVLALGAPRETVDVRIPIACPSCRGDDLRLDFAGDSLAFECTECGGNWDPAACPTCSSEDLRVVLGESDDPVVACQNCESTFERPPIDGAW
ncbi:cupin domain-containing protein [Halovivax limisalsi]|uniref:cupin domain-containing protein n=1 Tax=Halovivax limisalsi TaxID=1453760 RepID=UPI001FFDB531|nr:cupin domain-containing protein [Halovivax limisalsi]